MLLIHHHQMLEKQGPWVAAANDPTTFFEKPVSYNQSIFINGGSDKGTFKLGYTRVGDKGILPNSEVNKNLVNLAATLNVTDKLTAGAGIGFFKYSWKRPLRNWI
jgi:hypothetical protein